MTQAEVTVIICYSEGIIDTRPSSSFLFFLIYGTDKAGTNVLAY